MRENIEPITGANLANLSLDHLQKELKFYKTYSSGPFSDENITSILRAIELEIAFRDL